MISEEDDNNEVEMNLNRNDNSDDEDTTDSIIDLVAGIEGALVDREHA